MSVCGRFVVSVRCPVEQETAADVAGEEGLLRGHRGGRQGSPSGDRCAIAALRRNIPGQPHARHGGYSFASCNNIVCYIVCRVLSNVVVWYA